MQIAPCKLTASHTDLLDILAFLVMIKPLFTVTNRTRVIIYDSQITSRAIHQNPRVDHQFKILADIRI